MVPTHATKNRVRYRYYISAACLRGPTDQAVGSVRRVPAHGIELAVKKAIVADRTGGMFGSDGLDYTCVTLTAIIAKIEVLPSQLAIHYKPDGNPASKDYDMDDEQRASTKARVLIIPWKKASIAREVLRSNPNSIDRIKPIKAGPRVALIRSIGLGRLWLRQTVDGKATVASIAADNACGLRKVNMTISLAFLAPSLVTAAVEGRLPRGLSVRTLRDPRPEWSHQMSQLGLGS